MNNITIYTDGAYSSARNQGGIGIIVLNNGKKIYEYGNMYKNVTNNKMEVGAIIIALRLIKKPIDSLTIYSDSMYAIGCATLGWKRKKNILLWEEFDKQYSRVKQLCPKIEFIHVKGHQSGNIDEHAEWNNECDKLAVKYSQLI